MHQIIRRTFVTTCLLIVGVLIWAGVYTRKQGFTHTWREALEAEIANQGHYVDIGKLTLGAFRGLVAEDVRFFNDPERTRLVAEINDIYLDVGLERILEKKVSINTVDIKNGRMEIPLNPENPELGTKLDIRDISGRIALTESLVEIVRAEANLSGVNVYLKGSLVRAPNQPDGIDTAGREALAATIDKAQSLKRLIDTLAKFEFPGGAPTMEIDLRGDLRDFASLTAQVKINSGHFRKRGSDYNLRSLDIEAEIDRRTGQVKVPEFEIQDDSGLLDAEGSWDRDSDTVRFAVNSSADIVNILEFFFPNRRWGEVVFFQPPSFTAEGSVDFARVRNRKGAGPYFPGAILGTFQTEQFVSSGVVFSGISGTFSAEDNRFYIRNLRADHKTGVGFLNVKFEPGNGRESLLFQSEIKMDPRVLAPFLRDEEAQRFLRKWEFSDNSGVYLAASGKSSSLDLGDIQAKGVIDLRDFELNGIPFLELETDFVLEDEERWYRNVRLTRSDGQIEAGLAYTDTATRKWEIVGGRSSVDLIEGFGAFSPLLKSFFNSYRFASPPTLKIRGIVDGRDASALGEEERETDLEIELSGKGIVEVPLMGRDLQLDSPEGMVHFRQDRVGLGSMKAALCGGTVSIDGDFPMSRAEDRSFDLGLKFSEVGIRSLGKIFGWDNDAMGFVEGSVSLSGGGRDISSLNGSGTISVSNRDLFELSPFRGLKPLLEEHEIEIEMNTGRSNGQFLLENGVITTVDLNLLSDSANLAGNLIIDLNRRSIEGTFFPVDSPSAHQFYCRGTIGGPRWIRTDGKGSTATFSGP